MGYFIDGVWKIEKIQSDFSNTPAIFTSVLKVSSCSVDIIKFLLKLGADINYPNRYGDSPLVVALEISNDEAVIRMLLEEGAEVNKLDRLGRTPLFRYLQREDSCVGIVKILLEFKADVNQKERYGDSPLTTAIHNSKDDAVIRLLVERGAEINNLNNFHKAPLVVLLGHRKSCLVDTVKFMLAKGADINCVNKYGCSPLMVALKNSRGEAVIQALLENGAEVNMVCEYGRTPLLLSLVYYCAEDNCSIGIVKLLLRYKAEVNVIDTYGDSPLTTALRRSRSIEIIQVLLEEGASVDILDRAGKSPLCIAFRNSSNDIVKLLLEAGSPPNACTCHTSSLYCATDLPYSGLREDILKLLLEANTEVNLVNQYGQSVLCFAFQNGAKAHDIKLLLDAGVTLNACERHSSSLICATDHWPDTPLREDVVQLLLNKGASVGDEGFEVLKNALQCNFETGAIQLLLALPGMDTCVVGGESEESLLHLAVENSNCSLDAVKLFINHKSVVHSKTENGDIPLHSAVRNKNCDPSVINLLVKHGSPVDAKNIFDETPLILAMKQNCDANILKELLMAGANIGNVKFSSNIFGELDVLELVTREYWMCREPVILDSCRMLVKFYYLQHRECDIKHLERASKEKRLNRCIASYGIEELSSFVNQCLNELRKMDLIQVGHGRTFRELVAGIPDEKSYDLDQTLKHMVENSFPAFLDVTFGDFPVFHDVIFARVKKLMIEQKYCPDSLIVGRVSLNYVVLRKIAASLSDDDFLKFILAFYYPGKHYNSV